MVRPSAPPFLVRISPVICAGLALSGCTGPIIDRDSSVLTRSVIDAVRREMIEAEQAPGYPILSAAIKTGSRMAIWLSERI